MELIDLTIAFTDKMPVYPGDPLPEIKQIARLEKDGYNDFRVKTGMHAGTHMDSSLHMIKGGKYLSEINVEKFFGRGVLIDARGEKIVKEKLLSGLPIKKGDIVLVMTGFHKNFGKNSYYLKYPEINQEFAQKLIGLGVKIMGLDTPSPDRPPFKIHKLLLGNGVLIIENLTNLEKLLGKKRFEVFALPAKFQTEAAPVRVIAKI